jgi:hypothetical protein
MFDIFINWNKKNQKTMSKTYPFLPRMYVNVELTKLRVQGLEEKYPYDIERLTAFYLGSINGDIRANFNMDRLGKHHLQLVITIAMYVAVVDGDVTSDREYENLAKRFLLTATNPDYEWFATKGVHSSLELSILLGGDPEAPWFDLEKHLLHNNQL